jgi:hypothetical protein
MNSERWYKSPNLMSDLAGMLADGPLHEAMLILKERAKARRLTNADVTALALQHAHLVGYQKALDDLNDLSQPPKKRTVPKLTEWDKT